MAAYSLVNGVVLFNAVTHPPTIGFDAAEHLAYVEVLSQGRLATPESTYEFFSPPLAYLMPAMLVRFFSFDTLAAARAALVLNVALSIGSLIFMLRICDLVARDDRWVKFGALGFLAVLPAYYHSFAYLRGEPFIMLFGTAATYAILKFSTAGAIRFPVLKSGALLGLAALSRQWALLLLPGILLWSAWPSRRDSLLALRRFRFAVSAALVAITISGWFYVTLQLRYGSPAAFNRARAPKFSLQNQPSHFYTGLGGAALFSDPIRPAFPNQFLPIFYSTMWGDYWGYFTVYGKDARTGSWLPGDELSRALASTPRPDWLVTNRREIAPYLGRVNLLGLLPSVLAVLALISALLRRVNREQDGPRRQEIDVVRLLALQIVTSVLGYFWFLLSYPNPGKGDTINGLHLAQTYPLIAILSGILISRLIARVPRASVVIAAVFLGIFMHNLSACYTRFFVR